MDILQHADVRLDALVEEPTLLGAGLHGQGKGRQFACAFIDLNTKEVIREDLLRDLGRIVAFLLVDGVEQVKGTSDLGRLFGGRLVVFPL